MANEHLSELEISGFKKFENLTVDKIGLFNLIIGDNNVGKTSLLEALLIHPNKDKSLESLANIIYHVRKFKYLNGFFLSHFFSDTDNVFPQKMFFKQIKADKSFYSIKYEKTNTTTYSVIARKDIDVTDTKTIDPIQYSNAVEGQDISLNVPFIPFGSLYSHELTQQYSNNIQLFVDKKEKLLESLSHIIKNIKNIEVNASYSNSPMLLISESGKNKLSPLATYGDGSVKLFRILLSLFSNDHYNRLMIDELDAGVHYSRLKDFIKSLLIIAKEQKKQIFATSHSKECIEAYTLALREIGYESDARIIKLAETKSGIKSYTMLFEEFEKALIAESEIR
ncbi:MAG: AAA family ATPase [Bacteroidota bacterium]